MATMVTIPLHGSKATNSTNNNSSTSNMAKKMGSDSFEPTRTRYFFRPNNSYDNLQYYNALLEARSSGEGNVNVIEASLPHILNLETRNGPQFNTTIISSLGARQVSKQTTNETSRLGHLDKKISHVEPRSLRQRIAQLNEPEYQQLHRLLHQHFCAQKKRSSSCGDDDNHADFESLSGYDAEDPATWPSNWLAQAPNMILEPDAYLEHRPTLNSYQRQLIHNISMKYEYLVEHYVQRIENETHKISLNQRSHALPSKSVSFGPSMEAYKAVLKPINEESSTFQSLRECHDKQGEAMAHSYTAKANGQQHESSGKFNKWSSKMMKIYLKKGVH